MKKTIAVTVCTALAACATQPTGENYRPIVYTKGVDTARLEDDLRECQAYAARVAGAAEQAAAGAFADMSGGTVAGERDQRNVIRRCVAGRGYNVFQ